MFDILLRSLRTEGIREGGYLYKKLSLKGSYTITGGWCWTRESVPFAAVCGRSYTVKWQFCLFAFSP